MNLRFIIVSLCMVYVQVSSLNLLGVFDKIYSKCQRTNSTSKCLKVQAVKIAQRALLSNGFKITDGLSIVKSEDVSLFNTFNDNLREDQLENLNSTEINELLYNTTARFLDTYRFQLSVPELLEEARKKKNKKNFIGPFLAALAIKGFFMSAAYKGIAVMSGAAILIGKIALLLTALLGLKKLVSDGHEQTTFEIVKHPVFSQSHSHSSSHGSHSDSDDHYYRNLGSDEEMVMQDRIFNNRVFNKPYRGYFPKN